MLDRVALVRPQASDAQDQENLMLMTVHKTYFRPKHHGCGARRARSRRLPLASSVAVRSWPDGEPLASPLHGAAGRRHPANMPRDWYRERHQRELTGHAER